VQSLLTAGDKTHARMELQKMAEANPNDGQLQLSVAMLAIEAKDYELGKRFLHNALQDERTMNVAKIYLGEIAKEEKTGKKWSAGCCLSKVLNLFRPKPA